MNKKKHNKIQKLGIGIDEVHSKNSRKLKKAKNANNYELKLHPGAIIGDGDRN